MPNKPLSKFVNQKDAVDAIKKKLLGRSLNYKEIYSIMDEIANDRLGNVLTTYFTASGYSEGFSNNELYFLTKAMVETGEKLNFKGIVADKHSIGGIPGTRTTLILVPIVAAAGFLIPKSSSRAITTSGTADDMEILAPVSISREKILKVVEKTNACIVWGGNFNIAPADDVIIKVEKPLMFESLDKIVVSIMAKKIAFGSTHVVIDLPYGYSLKVTTLEDAETLKRKFQYIAGKFNIKIKVLIHKTDQPAGQGVGPTLETKDALKVLEQTSDRPLDLEIRSLHLAGNLLDLCLKDAKKSLQEYVKKNYGNSFNWAKVILENKFALSKMKQIIKEQGGNPDVKSSSLKPGKFSFEFKTRKTEKIKKIHSKNLAIIAKILGSPKQKKSGIFLNKKINETAQPGDTIYTLYSEKVYNLKEAKETMDNFPFLEFE
jgi:putative thymidine phosphorylase